MMKKRISISVLTLLFLVSTTGMPIWSHYCEMMGEKSLSKCEMCKVEIEKIEPSCCSEEISDNSVIIESEKSACCQEEFVYNKVEDQYLFNKFDLNSISSSEKLIQTFSLIPPSVNFSLEESFYCDSSPPFLISSEIHIFNSVLLI